MDFAIVGPRETEPLQSFSEGLGRELERHGHRPVEPDRASLVLNFFPPGRPRPFRRRAQAVFVVGVSTLTDAEDEPRRAGYPLLVRSLSNLLITLEDDGAEDPDAHFLTPEQGYYSVQGNGCGNGYFSEVYRRLEPLATSRLVIENVFHDDLPESLWDGDDATRSIRWAGRRLDELDLLPAPFPIDEILAPREMKHVKRLYGIGGLSYGNVSARKDETRFWMSASGVDKSRLDEVGRDVLLVTDYDEERSAMVLSVPPGVEPRRVSVDAIEHWMIYREHPGVGAVLHVHAWMDDVPSTEFNYPCGTYELGKAVSDIVRLAPDPSRCVVGLKNHGLTITGASLEEIFERVEGRLVKSVPMT